MAQHERIVVDIDDVGARYFALCDEVDARPESGADIEELPHAFACERLDGTAVEHARGPDRGGGTRVLCAHTLGEDPVDLVVVFAPVESVPHPRGLWFAHGFDEPVDEPLVAGLGAGHAVRRAGAIRSRSAHQRRPSATAAT